MPKLIAANFVKNEAHCIEKMFNSVLPYVEDSYILIDDRTTDNTAEICEEYGCHTKYFKFENFGKTWNTLLKWISGKSDWTVFIAPDETINSDFGEMLKPLAEQIDNTDIDGVWFTRRHWVDLEKRTLFEKDKIWFPDWQMRLLRNDYPRIHLINYVHEWPIGLRNTIRISDKEINHFNAYYKPRINYNWDEMNQLYGRLAEEQKKDGGKDIWPD
jgi:glycosyltransferase involved in cell wall biosynthesis